MDGERGIETERAPVVNPRRRVALFDLSFAVDAERESCSWYITTRSFLLREPSRRALGRGGGAARDIPVAERGAVARSGRGTRPTNASQRRSPTSRSIFCGSPTRPASISMPRSGARPRATRRSTRPKRPGARRRSTTDCSGSIDPGGFSRHSRGAAAERRVELRASANRVPTRASHGPACISRRFSVFTRPVLLR